MRIGILGYGSIGSRHGTNLISLGHKIIIHDPAMAESLPPEEVIRQADAVVIASPTSEHLNHLTGCFLKDKPCFVEKPISDHLPKAPRALTHPLMVGYNMRFHPCIRKAEEWLGDGRIGQPLWASFICAQYSDKPEYLRDGVTLNWSHEIDLALYLLGEATVTGAMISEKDDMADILLRHKASSAQTAVHLDYVTKPEHRGFSIAGPDGIIIANLPGRSIILLDNDAVPKQVEQYPGSYDDDYMAEMQAFIARVEDKDDDDIIGCTAEEAIEVLKVCIKAKKMAGL